MDTWCVSKNQVSGTWIGQFSGNKYVRYEHFKLSTSKNA